ncbi:hypothetical protein YEEN111655_04110 [Yersinia entomophaga]
MWLVKKPIIICVSKMAMESPKGNQEDLVVIRCVNITDST